MISTIVFSGPSLSADDRAGYGAFTFRPPVAEGDVLRAMAAGVQRMAIIDGVFADGMAVLHKEILLALSRGIAIYGAASMGALRAAELDTFGMIGVGDIYESYRRGDLVEDEAVAVVHGPEVIGYRALTVPTVDALATLDALVRRGRIAAPDAERLGDAVRQAHFASRTWRRVVAAALDDPAQRSRMLSVLKRGRVERKRLDALMLLDRLVADSSAGAAPRPETPAPPMTPGFRSALARVSELDAGLA